MVYQSWWLGSRNYRGSSPNLPGGWVFFRQFELGLSKNKNPTPNFAILLFLFRWKMKRKFLVENARQENQTIIQRTLMLIFGVNGPNYGVSLAKWLCFTMQSGFASPCSISQVYNPFKSYSYICNQAVGLAHFHLNTCSFKVISILFLNRMIIDVCGWWLRKCDVPDR